MENQLVSEELPPVGGPMGGPMAAPMGVPMGGPMGASIGASMGAGGWSGEETAPTTVHISGLPPGDELS